MPLGENPAVHEPPWTDQEVTASVSGSQDRECITMETCTEVVTWRGVSKSSTGYNSKR